MKPVVVSGLMIVALIVILPHGSALALEDNKAPVAAAPKKPPKDNPPKGKPVDAKPFLSPAQCTGLGGNVRPEGNCMSAFTCIRADENGVVRSVCINEPNQ